MVVSLEHIFLVCSLHNCVPTCDFQQCVILTSVDSDEPVKHPFKLKTPNDVRSVALESWDILANSKGFDQTAHHTTFSCKFHVTTQICFGL